MSSEKSNGFGWKNLLMGIFFIITSLIAFSDPSSDLVAIVYIFSILAILKGIFGLIDIDKSAFKFGVSVLDVIIGIFLFFNISVGIITLPYIFAVWFIVDSLGEIEASLFENMGSVFMFFSVIVGIIGVIIGISLFFNPIFSALTFAYLIGVYFMMCGIIYIADFFSKN